MYPPLALNGLKTRPAFPGTGFATGNCATVPDFGDADDFEEGLVEITSDLVRVDPDFRDATRGVGVGEGTATGWPGFVTSELFAPEPGSGPLKTCLTGAVTTRPIPQPTSTIVISTSASVLSIIVLLYRPLSSTQHIADKLLDVCIGCRPRTHQTMNIRFDKFVEMPASRVQLLNELLGQTNKKSIRFNRQRDVDLRRSTKTLGEFARHRVSVPCISQPHVVFQKADPLCG